MNLSNHINVGDIINGLKDACITADIFIHSHFHETILTQIFRNWQI